MPRRACDYGDPKDFSIRAGLVKEEGGRLVPVKLTIKNRPEIRARLLAEIRAIIGPDAPEQEVAAEADEVLMHFQNLWNLSGGVRQ